MGYTQDGIGYQSRDTSLEAALHSSEKKLTLRQLVLNLLVNADRPLSADEIASELGRPYVSVQPRLSELAAEGSVIDSGQRGKTSWGKSCILWVAA